MTNTALTTTDSASAEEMAMVQGDLAKLNPAERLALYRKVCESVGLNPLTQPFDYIILNGKMRLYALKGASDQLREIKKVSLRILDKSMQGDLFIVHTEAMTQDGRRDEDLGAVSVKGLQGEALANAIMKTITKSKRRVTLSICGLGWLDESEAETIPGASFPAVNPQTHELLPLSVVGGQEPDNRADREFAAPATDYKAIRAEFTHRVENIAGQGVMPETVKELISRMTGDEPITNRSLARAASMPDDSIQSSWNWLFNKHLPAPFPNAPATENTDAEIENPFPDEQSELDAERAAENTRKAISA